MAVVVLDRATEIDDLIDLCLRSSETPLPSH